jgi:hypothetical protein
VVLRIKGDDRVEVVIAVRLPTADLYKIGVSLGYNAEGLITRVTEYEFVSVRGTDEVRSVFDFIPRHREFASVESRVLRHVKSGAVLSGTEYELTVMHRGTLSVKVGGSVLPSASAAYGEAGAWSQTTLKIGFPEKGVYELRFFVDGVEDRPQLVDASGVKRKPYDAKMEAAALEKALLELRSTVEQGPKTAELVRESTRGAAQGGTSRLPRTQQARPSGDGLSGYDNSKASNVAPRRRQLRPPGPLAMIIRGQPLWQFDPEGVEAVRAKCRRYFHEVSGPISFGGKKHKSAALLVLQPGTRPDTFLPPSWSDDGRELGMVLFQMGYCVYFMMNVGGTALLETLTTVLRATTDSFVFLNVGHGTQLYDDDGDEDGGWDSAFVVAPEEGAVDECVVRDDTMLNRILAGANDSCKIVLLANTSHSGSIFDVQSALRQRRRLPPHLLSLGACADDEVQDGSRYVKTIRETLLERPRVTAREMEAVLRAQYSDGSQFSQRAELAASSEQIKDLPLIPGASAKPEPPLGQPIQDDQDLEQVELPAVWTALASRGPKLVGLPPPVKVTLVSWSSDYISESPPRSPREMERDDSSSSSGPSSEVDEEPKSSCCILI